MRRLSLLLLILISLRAAAQDDDSERGTYFSIGGGYLEQSATANLNFGVKVGHVSFTLSPIGVLKAGNGSTPFILANANLGLHVGNFLRVFGSYGWHPERHAVNGSTDSIQGFKYGYGLTLYKRMSWSTTHAEWSLFTTLEKTDKYIIPSIGVFKIL